MSNKEDIKPKSLTELIEEEEFASRKDTKGIINNNTKSGVSISETGDIDLSSSKFSHYKLPGNGVATERSLQSNTITVDKRILTDNISINRHRLNPALWELTDFKKTNGTKEQIVGNLNMTGTVLVKAWEPNLKKYVLIRRAIRMPMFSTTLNIPDAPENMDDSTGIERDLIEYLLKKNKED